MTTLAPMAGTAADRTPTGPSPWQRWLTLLRREWLQHRHGWTVVLLAPTVLVALALLFFPQAVQVNLDVDSADGVKQSLPPLAMLPAALQVMLMGAAVTGLTLVFTLLSLGTQMPGLARRDAQDRTVEFWRTLPVGDAAAIAATLVAHLWLLPIAALLVGAAGSLLLSLAMVAVTHGIGAWLSMPWGALATAGLALLLRLMLGLALAMLWLAPLTLMTMAASAWLKRWGVPTVAGLLVAGTQVVDRRLPVPVVGPALQDLLGHAGQALMHRSPTQGFTANGPSDLVEALPSLAGWALHDAGTALLGLASPAFGLALVGAAAGFALLVWRRRMG